MFAVQVPLSRRSGGVGKRVPSLSTEQYLWLDDTQVPPAISVGVSRSPVYHCVRSLTSWQNFEQALVFNLPNTAQTDGPLATNENPPRYLASFGQPSSRGESVPTVAPQMYGETDGRAAISCSRCVTRLWLQAAAPMICRPRSGITTRRAWC